LRSWRVPSQSRLGVEYTVSVDDGGVWSCTCPHYTFRHTICKHIVMVQTELSAPKPKYVVHPMVRDGVIEDRVYQRRFVERALEANTLAVLPTALGKTVIAELVAAELLHRHPGCRILFMAPTKPLALQHRESVLKHLKLREDEVAAVTGETAARASVWSNSRVRFVTATPQTVWNDYRNGLVRLEEFALLIFDECHRSRSRYAYTRLAEEYIRICPYPLILALTASPGSEEDKVVEVIKNLWIEQVVWMSEDDEEVSKYIPGIRVGWVRVKLPAEYEMIRNEIKGMIESVISRLRESGLLRMPLEAVNRKVLVGLMNRIRAEIDSGVKGPNIHYMTLLSAALSLYHAQELIESQHVYSLKHYLEEISRSELRSHKIIASTPDFRNLVRMVIQCTADHSKVDALASTLEAHFAEKLDDRVLVFANIRSTAEVLVDRLRDRGYRAALFIGRAEGKHGPRMSQDEQMKTLRAFKEGVYNVLVATSVGEEGLDIPECGLVVFYEPAVSGIRYIQRRGRTGRKLPGKAVILVADKTVDEYYFREGYRRAKRMDKILQQASQKTVKIERKAPKPPPGTPWPWTKTVEEPEPVVEIDVEPKQVSERGIVNVEPRQEVVSIKRPSSRELYYCRKNIYETLLKAGDKGVTLHEIMESISYSPEAVRKSLSRLEREGLIKKIGDRYVTTAIIRSKPLTVKPQGRIHTIAVEKIYPGFAVVMVDDSFRARLEPSAYNGPRDLIRKGRRFKARATITKMEGATTILIHDVVEA
jgi:ERCC4-related helicase/DNA-binding transcriptional ArsR family regulator